MKFMLSLLLSACVLLFTPTQTPVSGWRGIVPLHSTRADVERLIGKPNFKYDLYDIGNERVDIMYSSDPCTQGLQGSYTVPRDTVIRISVVPQNQLRFSDLRLDLGKYKKTEDAPEQHHAVYKNEEQGITYVVYEGNGGGSGVVQRILYGATAKDCHLRCSNAAAKKPCRSSQRE